MIVWIAFIHPEEKSNFNHQKKVCKNKDFTGVVMLPENTKIVDVNRYIKFDQIPSVIYEDLESIKKMIVKM